MIRPSLLPLSAALVGLGVVLTAAGLIVLATSGC